MHCFRKSPLVKMNRANFCPCDCIGWSKLYGGLKFHQRIRDLTSIVCNPPKQKMRLRRVADRFDRLQKILRGIQLL